MIHENAHGVGSDFADATLVLIRIFFEEVRHQQRDVFALAAQRRQRDGNDVETIVEIFAETVLGHQLREIGIRCGDDADVDFDHIDGAKPHEFFFLDHAKELGLSVEVDVPDLVQKDRSAVGDFKETTLGSDGAGERALDMAEER